MGRKRSPTSQMNVAEKQETKLAQRLNELIVDSNALKDYLDISLQAINQYRIGTSRPSLENLCKIADYYGVSVDYLLGRTDIKSPDTSIAAASKTTGLSESSIQALCNMNLWGITENARVIDFLLLDETKRKTTHHFRSILDLLNFFFRYKNNSNVKKAVSVNGWIYDENSTDGTISTNAIAVNDRVIENAVLMEIQQALVSLKQNCVKYPGEMENEVNSNAINPRKTD